MTTALLAAYDSGHSSLIGDYWVCRHESLNTRELNSWHERLVETHRPDIEGLGPSDCHGGALATDSPWCCFYRFYNAGRDNLGRPGRYVLLCAVFERSTIVRRDLSNFLETGLFDEVAQRQPTSGAISSALHCQLTTEAAALPPSFGAAQLAASPQWFHGPHSLLESWQACARLDIDQPFHWRFERQGSRVSAAVEQIGNSSAARIGGREPIHATRNDGKAVGWQTTPIASKRKTQMTKQIRIPALIFASGLLLGIVAGGFLSVRARQWGIVPAQADSQVLDRDAMADWLEHYRSDESGKLVSTNELLVRLQSNDWRIIADERSPASMPPGHDGLDTRPPIPQGEIPIPRGSQRHSPALKEPAIR